MNLVDPDGRIAGFDDALILEAQEDTAAVRGGMSAIQKLCDTLERSMIRRLEGMGAKVRRIGLQANKGSRADDLQQCIWEIQKLGKTFRLRFGWSGHGGLSNHFNIRGPMNHMPLEAFDDIMGWIISSM